MLPTFTTPRLALCPATDADLDALWRLLTDAQVRRYLCDDRVLTRAEVQTILAEDIAHGSAGMGLWLMRGHARDLVGCVGLHPVSSEIVAHAPHLAGEVEPTIALAPDHWGRGLAAEALGAVVAYAFDTPRPRALGRCGRRAERALASAHAAYRLHPDRHYRDRTMLPVADLAPGAIRVPGAGRAAALVSDGTCSGHL